MKLDKIFYFLIICLLGSCTRLGGLGMQRHRFGDLPTKIIWIQVAGLTEEHFAMLNFSMPNTYEKSSFSKSRCVGKVWSYNLYKLRPTSFTSFLSQLTGRKNFHENCDDFKLVPVWNFLRENRAAKGVLENGSYGNDSLLKASLCKGKKEEQFLKDLVFWNMEKAPKNHNNFFHHQEKTSFRPDNIYYDRSCQQSSDCYGMLSKNVDLIYDSYFKNLSNYFFLIRDFEYERKLKARDFLGAKKNLIEIEKIFFSFSKMAEENKQVLLLLTSANPRNFEFPEQGKDWMSFEKSGNPIIYRSSSLMGTVLAVGSRSENFCGIYEEAEILQRIIKPFNGLDSD